jgi:hypothetical protein
MRKKCAMISNNNGKGGIYMWQQAVIIQEDEMKKATGKNGKDARLQKIAAKVIRRNYKGLKRLSKN